MAITLAILSDLHCHPSNARPWGSLLHCDAPRSPANKHPIESLLNLIEREKLTAAMLLVPGDLTDRSNSDGLTAAWAFSVEVGKKLGAKSIVATLGNHDVDYK